MIGANVAFCILLLSSSTPCIDASGNANCVKQHAEVLRVHSQGLVQGHPRMNMSLVQACPVHQMCVRSRMAWTRTRSTLHVSLRLERMYEERLVQDQGICCRHKYVAFSACLPSVMRCIATDCVPFSANFWKSLTVMS